MECEVSPAEACTLLRAWAKHAEVQGQRRQGFKGVASPSPAPGRLVTVYPQRKYSELFPRLFWDFSSTHYNAPLLAAIACKHVPWTYVSLSLWQLDPALSRGRRLQRQNAAVHGRPHHAWQAIGPEGDATVVSVESLVRVNWVSKRKGPHLLVNRPSLWLGQFDEDGSNSTTFLNITSFVGHTVLRYFGLGKTKFSLFTPPPSVYVGTEGMCI